LARPAYASLAALSSLVLLTGCEGFASLFKPYHPTLIRAQEPVSRATDPALLADFNLSGHRTNAGLPFGAWDSDPGDATQQCRVRLLDSVRVGEAGYGLMIEYDVDSPNPAYNGFWMKLPEVPLARYDVLALTIKGDASRGFTRRLWLELKDHDRVARFLLEDVTSEWTRRRIPLRAFTDIRHVRTATEFVLVFDVDTVTATQGTVYLDDVALEPQ